MEKMDFREKDDNTLPKCNGLQSANLPKGCFLARNSSILCAEEVMRHVFMGNQHCDLHCFTLWSDIIDSFKINVNIGFVILDDTKECSADILVMLKNEKTKRVELCSPNWIPHLPSHIRRLFIYGGKWLNDNLLYDIILKVPNISTLEIENGSKLTNNAIQFLITKCRYLEHFYINSCEKITDVTLLSLANASAHLKTVCLICNSVPFRYDAFKCLIAKQSSILFAFCTVQ